MDIYFINLSRRQDRRERMETQARKLGLSLIRVEALDAEDVPARDLARWFERKGPLGEIPKGDQCCSLSHRRAWETLVQSGRDHAAILEDDVTLGEGARFILGSEAWMPQDIGLIKLEHYGPMRQSVLLSDLMTVGGGFRLGRMRSRHTGAAAYLLSRRAAKLLLEMSRFDLPVDHLLFNPNNSKIFGRLHPWQLLPAVARQAQEARSDIEGWRVDLRKFDATYLKRELVRFSYDLKLLPEQLALLASGRAKFMRVGTHSPGLSGR